MSSLHLLVLGLLSFVSQFNIARAVCPFITDGTPLVKNVPDNSIPSESDYNEALDTLDIRAVFDDIYDVMANSNECFPADSFNGVTSYAGLFLRNAWHCAGTFRATDGKGGCAGGRIRYLPESNWEDNVNLDKARALLTPIKNKYGNALSWGDLFIFAGNAAILAGDGPIIEVCAGRIDEVDGTNSLPLDDLTTCNENGEECQPPIGASTVGLIYVNPQGVEGVPNATRSAPRIREIFNRMGMSDLEAVGLIGGGHAFGKCHGACPLGAGPDVVEQPKFPWPGNCFTGTSPKASEIFTSGIEGQWTSSPFEWDNEYFKLLNENVDDYELIIGPGGAYQWKNRFNGLLMLTTDIAFTRDSKYLKIVEKFANNIQELDFYFSRAWAKLTTSGGKFANNTFCVSPDGVKPRRDDSCERFKRTPFIKRLLRKCNKFNRRGCNFRCKSNEFRFSNEYLCEDCQDVFGESCLLCQDGMGCKKCMNGYKLAQNACGLWYCMPDHY